MLRKASWAVVGMAGLSVLLCGGCSAEAQSGKADARASEQAVPPEEAAGLRDTVEALRAEVSQLRQEVTRLRAQVSGTGGSGAAGTAQGTGAQQGTGSAAQGTSGSNATSTAQGTGGSGTAGTAQGTGAQQGTGGSGTAGTGAQAGQGVSDVPPPGSGVPAPRGTAVVNAVYTGVVRSVSGQRVVINREDGTPLTLEVDAQTRVLRDGRNIGVRQLEKGEQVRAVVDLVGQEQTVEIAVQPPALKE